MTDGYYGYKMDMWGIGCILFEVMSLYPLFPGKNESDQIECIHKVLGTPDEALLNKFKQYSKHMKYSFKRRAGSGIRKLVPHASRECLDLMEQLLQYDPEKRMSAKHALRHPWFAELQAREVPSKSPAQVPVQVKAAAKAEAAHAAVSRYKAALDSKMTTGASQSEKLSESKTMSPESGARAAKPTPFALPAPAVGEGKPQSVKEAAAGEKGSPSPAPDAKKSAIQHSSGSYLAKGRRKKPHISKHLGSSGGYVLPMASLVQLGSPQPPVQVHAMSGPLRAPAGMTINTGSKYQPPPRASDGPLSPLRHGKAHASSALRGGTHVAAHTGHYQGSPAPLYSSLHSGTSIPLPGKTGPVHAGAQHSATLAGYSHHSLSKAVARKSAAGTGSLTYSKGGWKQSSSGRSIRPAQYITGGPKSRRAVAAPPKGRHKGTNKLMRSKYPVPNFG